MYCTDVLETKTAPSRLMSIDAYTSETTPSQIRLSLNKLLIHFSASYHACSAWAKFSGSPGPKTARASVFGNGFSLEKPLKQLRLTSPIKAVHSKRRGELEKRIESSQGLAATIVPTVISGCDHSRHAPMTARVPLHPPTRGLLHVGSSFLRQSAIPSIAIA